MNSKKKYSKKSESGFLKAATDALRAKLALIK